MGFTYDDELDGEEEDDTWRNNVMIDKWAYKNHKDMKELEEELYNRRMKNHYAHNPQYIEEDYYGEDGEPIEGEDQQKKEESKAEAKEESKPVAKEEEKKESTTAAAT